MMQNCRSYAYLSPERGLRWRRWRWGLLLMIRRRTSRGIGIAGGMVGMVAVAVIMLVVMSVVGAVIGQRQSGDGQNLKTESYGGTVTFFQTGILLSA